MEYGLGPDKKVGAGGQVSVLATAAVSFLWHNFKRFAGVILVGVLLVGLPYVMCHKAYSVGYSKGYAQCAKDRPTYGSVGTVINKVQEDFKALGLTLNVWKLKLKLGI